MQTIYRGKEPRFMARWSVPLVLIISSLLLMLAGNELGGELRYERSAILSGEFWRLFSAHLIHLGWSHLALNVGGLILVWLLCGNSLTAGLWWLVTLVSALGVSLGMLLFDPSLQWYVGLSGVLHGLLVTGSSIAWLKGERESLLLLVAVTAKLLWEQLAGPLPGSEAGAGGHVVVDAHLYGAVTGALLTGCLYAIPSIRHRLQLTRDIVANGK